MRILKIVGWIALSALVICVALFAFSYYNYFGKFPEDRNKYSDYIGHIDQETALLNDVFTLCGEGAIYKTHHGAPKDAYNGGKNTFKKRVLESYKTNGATESGYVNFRFLINCEGNPGWFEVLEIDMNYEKTNHNPEMVSQLLSITSDPTNWSIYKVGEDPVNYYHYVSYRIENGKITEILP